MPKLRLIPEALIKMMKNYNFFLTMFFTARCIFEKSLKELEREMSRSYAQGVVCDEEAILGTCFATFKESRLFFGTTISKTELLKPLTDRKTMSLHVLPAVVQGIKSGVLSRRQDITPDFRREYPTPQYRNMTRTWDDSGNEGGRNGNGRPGNSPGNGGRDNRNNVVQIRFRINDRIRQTINPILQRHQGRMNISSLLTYADTTAERVLGQNFQNACLRALIVGACHRDCRRQHLENPPPQLIRNIVEGMQPGIQRCVRDGPQRRST